MKDWMTATRRRTAATILAAVAGLLVTAGLAVAAAATIGAGSATVKGHREKIAVDARGVAVYELAPETARHLLCTSAQCLQFWPPVKAGTRLSRGAGVHGKLGTLKRKGLEQVTLNGHPLYTFLEDGGRKGVVNGQGLRSFGGTWLVFKEG